MDRVERTALVSALINVGLVFLKVFLAGLSGSLALLADAWHSGSDVVASGLVWAGARISRREGKGNLVLVENVVALAISVLILWAAVGIFRRVSAAVDAPITNLAIAIGGSLVAALVSYYAAQFKLYVGREVRSLSLIADGHHASEGRPDSGRPAVLGCGDREDRISESAQHIRSERRRAESEHPRLARFFVRRAWRGAPPRETRPTPRRGTTP